MSEVSGEIRNHGSGVTETQSRLITKSQMAAGTKETITCRNDALNYWVFRHISNGKYTTGELVVYWNGAQVQRATYGFGYKDDGAARTTFGAYTRGSYIGYTGGSWTSNWRYEVCGPQ